MIEGSVFLFLILAGEQGEVIEKYVGRLNSCEQSQKIFKTLEKKYKNVNGYLCLDKYRAKKKFAPKGTPRQEFNIDHLKKLILPKPSPIPYSP